MRTLALVAALMIGTAAIAQDAPQQPAGDAGMQATQDQAMPADSNAAPTSPAASGTAAPSADPAMQSGQAMTPPADSTAMPASDSGASAGASGGTGMQQPSAAPSSYPLCSRTVKDRCRNRGGK